jgi:hypothetical protein
MKSRFLYIVFAIMLVILVSPFIRQEGKIGALTATLLLTMIPLASYYAFSGDRMRAMIIILLGIRSSDGQHLYGDYCSADCWKIFITAGGSGLGKS